LTHQDSNIKFLIIITTILFTNHADATSYQPTWKSDWKIKRTGNWRDGQYLNLVREVSLGNKTVKVGVNFTCQSRGDSKVEYSKKPISTWGGGYIRLHNPESISFPEAPEITKSPFLYYMHEQDRFLNSKYINIFFSAFEKPNAYKVNFSSVKLVYKKYHDAIERCRVQYETYISKEVEKYYAYVAEQEQLKKEQSIRDAADKIEREKRRQESKKQKEITQVIQIAGLLFAAIIGILIIRLLFSKLKKTKSVIANNIATHKNNKEAKRLYKIATEEANRLYKTATDAAVDETVRIAINKKSSQQVNADDIRICSSCTGKGCTSCSGKGWILKP